MNKHVPHFHAAFSLVLAVGIFTYIQVLYTEQTYAEDNFNTEISQSLTTTNATPTQEPTPILTPTPAPTISPTPTPVQTVTPNTTTNTNTINTNVIVQPLPGTVDSTVNSSGSGSSSSTLNQTQTQAQNQIQTTSASGGVQVFRLQTPKSFVANTGVCNSGHIALSWQPSEGATNYRILRNNVKVYEGKDVSFTDRELARDAEYTYVLFAFNSSSYAEPVTTKGKSPKPCETTQTQHTGVATSTQPVQPISNMPVGAVPNPTSVTNTVATTAPAKVIVPSRDAVNTVQSTEAITSTTVYKLKSPTSLSANIGYCGSTAIRLSWQSSEGATSYRLLRNNVKVYEGKDFSFYDSGLSPDTEYAYSVTAHYSYVSSEPIYVKIRSTKACEGSEKKEIANVPVVASTSTNQREVREVRETREAREVIKQQVTPTTTTTAQLPPREVRDDVQTQVATTTQLPPREVREVIKPEIAAKIITAGTQVQNLGVALETAKTVIDSSRDEIRKIIDIKVTKALEGLSAEQLAVVTEEVQSRRNKLIDELDQDFKDTTLLNSDKVTGIKSKIDNGVGEINALIAQKFTQAPKAEVPDAVIEHKDVKEVLMTLAVETEKTTKLLNEQGADLLYKDTNKDGISDYESVHVYNIDPVAPSPVTVYEGKKVTAGEKIALGLDPTKEEVVKVVREEPKASIAPLATSYKVDKVSLSEEKKVVLSGKALPNSFITIYIYSTPVIVTVKTDKDGEWHYVMDKELESGEHTVYTATVNNTGKILAQSSGFQFVKTAEAATLGSLPAIQVTSEVQKPGLFNPGILMTIGVMFLIVIISSLIAIGVYSKSTNA